MYLERHRTVDFAEIASHNTTRTTALTGNYSPITRILPLIFGGKGGNSAIEEILNFVHGGPLRIAPGKGAKIPI